MINELEIERYLKENFDVEFVSSPVFVTYEIVNDEVISSQHKTDTYIINGIQMLENLNRDGLKKLYVFRDQIANIIFPIPNLNTGGDSMVIRMAPIYGNIRYKLNKKDERRSKTRRD